MKKYWNLTLSILILSLNLPAAAAQLRFEASTELVASSNPVQLQRVRLKNQQQVLQAALVELEQLPELRTHLLTRRELEGLALHASQLEHENQLASSDTPSRYNSRLTLDTQRVSTYFLKADQESPLLETYTLLRSKQEALYQALENLPEGPLPVQLQSQFQIVQFLELGLKAYEQKQWTLARDRFSEVLKRDPKIAQAYNIRGRVWLMLNKPLSALRDFDQALKLHPELSSAHFNRGYIYSLGQKPSLALQAFNQAIALDGNNALYYNNRGTIHNQLGEFKLALEDFNRAVALRNQEASYHRNRAKTWLFLKSPAKALADYDTAIALAPRNTDYLLERGQLKAAQKDLKGALHDYTKALFLEPENTQALYLRGQIYTQMNIRHLAISDYTRGIAINPDSPYFARRGKVHGLNRDQLKRIQDFSVVIQKHPQLIEAWFERGSAYLYSRQPARALSDFERGLKLAQSAGKVKAEYYFYRGLALRELKRCDAALKDFEKACSLGLSEACEHGCGPQPQYQALPTSTSKPADKADSKPEEAEKPKESAAPTPANKSTESERKPPPPAAAPAGS